METILFWEEIELSGRKKIPNGWMRLVRMSHDIKYVKTVIPGIRVNFIPATRM